MNKAIAIANNDTVFLSWVYAAPIEQCLGFAIYRKNTHGVRTPLPAWVGFKGDSNKTWQPRDTTQWPVQKFSWRDFAAKRGETYSYDIVPMIGSKNSLQGLNDQMLTTNSITLSPQLGVFAAYFNRGILSTQALAHALPKANSGPNPQVLRDRIDQPADPLRKRLAGQLIEGLTLLIDRAEQRGGVMYAALYELNDPELLQRLLLAKDKLHIIVSNTGPDDAENTPARQALHEAGVNIIDRMLGSGHIGHNKFMVYVDADKTPRAVLTGSTNWSYTGVCTQSNNALIIEDTTVATAYLEYWQRLKTDAAQQAPQLRQSNLTPVTVSVDNAKLSLWFSPNTKLKTKPSKNPKPPVDMQAVFELMSQAQQAILFLVFQPGTPSIIEHAAACENAKPGLLIYGAATDPKAAEKFDTLLFHRTAKTSSRVVVTSAINNQFAYWQKELLKLPGAHAIIHDKIVVIDPLSDDCVVITGSHNLGYRASYNNDENLVIVQGHKPLAAAYATHVMDIYDHYRWRYVLQQLKTKAFTGLEGSPAWQKKYFATDSPARQETLFWTGQAVSG
ncbi:MAG: hypothetical protein HY080_01350 [Gammaproteobacteria bacterium]|nr:hypothetical protein [Gammaproteobacteria bacterium]